MFGYHNNWFWVAHIQTTKVTTKKGLLGGIYLTWVVKIKGIINSIYINVPRNTMWVFTLNTKEYHMRIYIWSQNIKIWGIGNKM